MKGLSEEIEILFELQPNSLERWYEFGRIDWVSELEYPEWTAKEINKFLKFGIQS